MCGLLSPRLHDRSVYRGLLPYLPHLLSTTPRSNIPCSSLGDHPNAKRGIVGTSFKAVLATGAWCMNFPSPDGGIQALLSAADAIPNSLLLGCGSLCTIKAFIFMSLHLQKLDRPNIAFVYHGAQSGWR